MPAQAPNMAVESPIIPTPTAHVIVTQLEHNGADESAPEV
jgi:hypothetical protein